MKRVMLSLGILIIVAVGSLLGYTYIGPYFGADFSAPVEEVRIPIVLDSTSLEGQ
ncbi:MAG: hypothetical protein OXE94_09665 [Aestuariivita sp.]|nr:hypothetical protein [Aestuariivita sp.]MCY4203884.1 hypothetical protein [Aestuariivita sp.]MCY4287864.1 hypothetical protein [Aestuariivita sp.]MCY4345317.1 hypothetical protein [Aestuariivita sp.]